nr:ABC transporter ATP-binding protein [Corynebacterium mendelii]
MDRVSMTVPEGSVYGFIGRNGAGKSTASRIITSLATPSLGTVRVLGGFPGDPEVRARIGVMADVPGFDGWMTATQVITDACRLKGHGRASAAAEAGLLLELVGLQRNHRPVGGFSRGMRQRLGLARALAGSPELLILDEPTSALDPVGHSDVLEIITRLKGVATVVFSTHLLDDVEQVADRIGVLHNGRLVAEGPLDGLLDTARSGGTISLTLTGGSNPGEVAAAISPHPWCTRAEVNNDRSITITTTDPERTYRAIPGILVAAHAGLVDMTQKTTTLAEFFNHVTAPPSDATGGRTTSTAKQ